MILVIDNFDSFTFNIVQYLRELGQTVEVYRNDAITIEDVEKMDPSHLIISPGPSNPDKAGISIEVIQYFKGKKPILGICLGHQCIGQALGGEIVRAKKLYHGKTSVIRHQAKGVFRGLANDLSAARYHSLVIRKESLPEELEITASSEDGEIMGVRHKELDIEGIQFHPESIASEHGHQMLKNFISRETSTETVTKQTLKSLWKKEDLSFDQCRRIMQEMAEGKPTPAQMASMLTALSLKGETVKEIAGFASVMRERASVISKPEHKKLIDTCGTGGDASGTFNISTVSAFVTAGAGLSVAKHGNRSITSRCGSADVLEGLGLNLDLSPEQISSALAEVGICFMFAQKLHSSMKHVVGVRKEIGIRTVFNVLGPLSNPAKAEHQIIGVFDKKLTAKVAEALGILGLERAMVVHGEDGLDEISLCAPSQISEMKDGWVRTYRFSPEDHGMNYCSSKDLLGGDLKDNVEIARSVLSNRREGSLAAKSDIVILNAAGALYTAGKAESWREALDLARHSIESGAALKKLEQLIDFSQSFR